MPLKFRIVPAEIVAADNSELLQQMLIHLRNRSRQQHGKFLEKRLNRHLWIDLEPGHRSNSLSRVVTLVIAQFSNLAHAAFSHRRKIGCGRKRHQPCVGADVAGGPGAPDVLLARRQSQHVTAPALVVHGLADKPAGHVMHEFPACRENAEMRTAK